MELYYENSKGEILNLMSEEITAQDPESLFNDSWDYTASAGTGNGENIKRIYKGSMEHDLEVSIMSETEDEFMTSMKQMHDVFEYDVRLMTPGKLYCNGFYRTCYAIASSYSNYEELFQYVDKKIKFLSGYPFWIKESVFSYEQMNTSGDDNTGFDYPFDYPFDYGTSSKNVYLINEEGVPSNFELYFYGPCINPEISIGSHTYAVNVEVNSGEYIIVKSLNHKVYRVKVNGDMESEYSNRGREFYLFEKIQPGTSVIAWSGNFNFDVCLIAERSEPPWI